MRKVLVGLLLLLFLVIFLWMYVINSQKIAVYVDGTKVNSKQQAFIDEINYQIYIPLDFVTESLGGAAFWSSDKKTVYIKKDRTILVLPVGGGKPLVNGQVQELNEPVRTLKGRTWVQLKFISEVLGYSFSWHEENRTVEINTQASEARDPMRPRYADFHMQGMVTFSYDDGWLSQYNVAYPLHKKYNLPASFNIVTGWTGVENGYMTNPQLQELARAGFEIASHSDHHPNEKGRYFKDITVAEANIEVAVSKHKLVSWGLPRVEGFVVPGSVYADWLVPIVSKEYQYARSLMGRSSPSQPVDSGKFHLISYSANLDKMDLPSFAVVNGHSPEDIIKLIDQAVAEKKWLILMMHNVGDDKNDIYTWDPAKLERVLQYIAAKPKSELLTVPLQDGVRFASGIGDYTCNSVAVKASSDSVVLGERVLLMSNGCDENGVEVPMASGYRPHWTLVSGGAELVDNQDGTAFLTVTRGSEAVVRCADASDPKVFADVRVSVK